MYLQKCNGALSIWATAGKMQMHAAARHREQQQQEKSAGVPATRTPALTRSSSPDQSTNFEFVPSLKEVITSSSTAALTYALEEAQAHAGVSAAASVLILPMLGHQVDARGTINCFHMTSGEVPPAGAASQMWSELNRCTHHLMCALDHLKRQGWVMGDITPFNTYYDTQLDMYRLSSSGHARRVGSTEFHLDTKRPSADMVVKTDKRRLHLTPGDVSRVNASSLDVLALMEVLVELGTGCGPRFIDAALATSFVSPPPAPVSKVDFLSGRLVITPAPVTPSASTQWRALNKLYDRTMIFVHHGGYQAWVDREIAPHDPVAADFMARVLVKRELRPSIEDLFDHEYLQRVYKREFDHIVATCPAWCERALAVVNTIQMIKASRQGLALHPTQHNHEIIWGDWVPKPHTHRGPYTGCAADIQPWRPQAPISSTSSGESSSRAVGTPSSCSSVETAKSPFANMSGYGFEAWPEPPLAEVCHKPLLDKLEML